MRGLIETEKSITSMEVAEMVDKDHSKLLRNIRNYIEQLAEAKIGLGEFFTESTYLDANNQSRPCYMVTKKGCEFIAHKLTGIKGTEFTARYINRFHEMDEHISTRKLTALEQLQLQSQAILEVNSKVDGVSAEVNDMRAELANLKMDLPILPIEADRITEAVKKKGVCIMGGKNSNAYNDAGLRARVYSDIYSTLKRNFGVRSYKSLKRSQCDRAVSVIEGYIPPIIIEELITDTNAQQSLL